MTIEDLTEKLGRLAGQLDNSMFMAQNSPMLPDSIHKIGLIGTMREVRDELAQLYKESGGEETLDLQA